MTTLPRDIDNMAIPALALAPGKAHHITATTTTARNTVAFDEDTRVISIYTNTPVYLEFGDETVTASPASHYFPKGIYYDFAIGGGKSVHFTHIAALTVSGDGDVYISEKQ